MPASCGVKRFPTFLGFRRNCRKLNLLLCSCLNFTAMVAAASFCCDKR
jgi:hypothetical protein